MSTPAPTHPAHAIENRHESLADAYVRVRQASVDLIASLSSEDACVQSMPDASPAKWHLAHITWFFETFLLEPLETNFTAYDPAFRELFNSYYNGIGKQFSRPDRGLITRPSLDDVMAYRQAVDARVLALLERRAGDCDVQTTVALGLHHEQQHQELLLMDIKHLLSLNPLEPAFVAAEPGASVAPANQWLDCEGGLLAFGHGDDTFHFDNESPRHKVWLEPFRLATRLVTNGEYLEFIAAGGYTDPLLWLADGWAWRNKESWEAPAYWRRRDSEWYEFTLHGTHRLDLGAPVSHISYFEADAYAQWASKRLASEFEWESCAPQPLALDRIVALHPPAASDIEGIQQCYGGLWQWTRSAYLPYPGFAPAAGAVGEYNGKFMSGQMTLRGSACITPGGHARATYRNFFYPWQRWAFCGLRLADDR